MQRRRVKIFESSLYATVLCDFDFGLSRHCLKKNVCEAGVSLKH